MSGTRHLLQGELAEIDPLGAETDLVNQRAVDPHDPPRFVRRRLFDVEGEDAGALTGSP